MQWIKSTERLPVAHTPVLVRRLDSSGRPNLWDAAQVVFIDALPQWNFMATEKHCEIDVLEWLDEDSDSDKAAAIEYLEGEIKHLLAAGKGGLVTLMRLKLQKILDILNGKKQ